MDAPPHSDARPRPGASLRFIEQFLAKTASGRLTGLLLGQLDAFNRITTTFGHDRASRFCADYTEQLRKSLPDGAPIIRLSGRRFVVLLPLDSIASVMDVAAHLCENDQKQVKVGNDSFLVDLTLGVAVYPTHADDAASLFRRAELALKEARENELSFDIYSPDTTQQHAALWKLESDLDRAIHGGELEVYYQPKVALEDSRVCGVEALVRWRSASGVFVPPQQFVPLAERTGSIVPLTWTVFDHALASAGMWSRFTKPFSIAVNIAPQVLTHPEFFARLTRLNQAMAEAGVDLTLELTEDSLVRSDDATPVILQRIRKLGVGISIDDFGKGYSSLSYLKEIPASEVKIDKRFVATIATNDKDRHIVKVIIELARAFGMHVVAEGVDSEENLQIVADLGCNCAQGFFIARPMRVDLVATWIDKVSSEAARWKVVVPNQSCRPQA